MEWDVRAESYTQEYLLARENVGNILLAPHNWHKLPQRTAE
jgi:hypothetical protein